MPKIPQSFIESYVKNPVDKVELEYEALDEVWDEYKKPKRELKLINNEVVVKEPYLQSVGRMTRVTTGHKELDEALSKGATPSQVLGQKLYTREEVERLFEKARIEMMDLTCQGDAPYSFVDKEELKQWLKENL